MKYGFATRLPSTPLFSSHQHVKISVSVNQLDFKKILVNTDIRTKHIIAKNVLYLSCIEIKLKYCTIFMLRQSMR